MTGTLINTQITIVVYILFGFILYKKNVIDDKSQLFMSDMTIDVFLPASIFASMLSSLTLEVLMNLATLLVMSIVLEFGIYLLTKLPSGYFTKSESCVNHYGMLVCNGGLVGTPVCEALFGSLGIMYCNVFMIPGRVMAYCAGESIFNPQLKRGFKDIMMSIVTNRIILVMALGFIFVAFKWTLPSPILSAITRIGNCVSPFSLMLVGSMAAQCTHIDSSLIKKISILSFIRLIAIPLPTLLICIALKLDFTTTAVIVLLMGMPVGSSCAGFSKKYHGNEEYATAAVMVSTLCSTVTLVLLMKIIESVF